MGLTDKLRDLTDLAKETAVEHRDQVNDAVQKAGQLADERTGGRYHDQIAKAGAKAEAYLEDLETGAGGGAGGAGEAGSAGEPGEAGATQSRPAPAGS